MGQSRSSRRSQARDQLASGNTYVLDASNVHALATTLEVYARDKHYTVLFDASVWARFDKLLADTRLEQLSQRQLLALSVFYKQLLRMLEAYENIVITPEVKVEITNMIAATHAQIDRQKVHYQQLNPAGKDRVGRLFSHLLRLDELMRKLRTRLETRARVAREPNEAVLSILVELVKSIATTLKLKKPDAVTASDVDERLVAR
ncbi:MAG: hypothetical protein ACYS22_17280, partial [Planctomycetota bacterium]